MTAEKTTREAAAEINRLGVSPVDLLLLSADTPREKIKQRPGPHSKSCNKPCNVAHKALDYVTARYVMERLDEVCGPDNWQSRHTMEGDKVQCSIGIRIDGRWTWKSDGAGETDIEGEKGSFSDALKRAAVSWGIARDLYPDAANHQGGGPAPSSSAAGRAPSRPAASPPPDYDSDNGDEESPVCPVHGYEWKTNRRGKYCSGKTNGEWCQEKP